MSICGSDWQGYLLLVGVLVAIVEAVAIQVWTVRRARQSFCRHDQITDFGLRFLLSSNHLFGRMFPLLSLSDEETDRLQAIRADGLGLTVIIWLVTGLGLWKLGIYACGGV